MASTFGHALASVALGSTCSRRYTSRKFWILGIVCAVLPDADVLAFRLGIPYGSFWGHRGFTHSLVFALITGILITWLFFRHDFSSRRGVGYVLFFSLSTASHAVLDATTNGGLGVAFFAPFDNTRYFFPFRPIQVSPIGIKNFSGEAGWQVIQSELLWIGLPCIAFILIARWANKQRGLTIETA